MLKANMQIFRHFSVHSIFVNRAPQHKSNLTPANGTITTPLCCYGQTICNCKIFLFLNHKLTGNVCFFIAQAIMLFQLKHPRKGVFNEGFRVEFLAQ